MARERLRKAVSDLTFEKLILRGEAHRPNASGSFLLYSGLMCQLRCVSRGLGVWMVLRRSRFSPGSVIDPPPLKWSALKYGFMRAKEDGSDVEETQA